ncbi:MAG: ABC transporter permease subunit [Desulfobacterales bacterium]
MNRFGEILVKGLSWGMGILFLTGISCIMVYLFSKGLGAVNLRMIFGNTPPLDAVFHGKAVFGGLFPAIAGTCLLVVFSVSLAIPLGISTGIWLAEYAGKRMKSLFSLLFDILAGIPSIVIGLFGFSLAIFLHRHFSQRIYPCLLISACSLAFLVIPYIIRTTETALEQIPHSIRITAPAMGATKLQNIFYVLVPHSLTGILSGIILAIGRCAEDTAVIMLTGVVATAGIPKSLLSNYEALPFYIYYISSQYADQQELLNGYGASVILILLCTGLFFMAYIIQKGLAYQALYRA